MIDLRFVPLETWPGEPTRNRRSSQFKAKFENTLDKLEVELKHLKASDIVVQVSLAREMIRNDGWPKSFAKPSAPGVIVSFIGKGGQMSFPCDTYINWKDNLRAIALSLEALRSVDRYGVTRRAEQYKGWLQLQAAGDLTVPEAAVFVSNHSGVPPDLLGDRINFTRAMRSAKSKLHPDNQDTGNRDKFELLAKAGDILEAAHGWKEGLR